MAIKGRVYDSVYGYVDVVTPIPLHFRSPYQQYPDSGGQLLLEGSGNSYIMVNCISETDFSLDIVRDGEVEPETITQMPWDVIGDGKVEIDPYIDGDGDGYSPYQGDCDDADSVIHRLTKWYSDQDGDGYSSGTFMLTCPRPQGYKLETELISSEFDCNDEQANINPSVNEICIDGIDQDCNGHDDLCLSMDENLDLCIREALENKIGYFKNGVLTPEDLQRIYSLDCNNEDIEHIEGLQHLVNLETLHLGNNEIQDISPLADLINMKNLTMYNNPIEDISPLANLTKLTRLNFGDNRIENISPLANLTELYHITISFNNIEDINALSNLTKLIWLDISYNQISDISSLKNLTNVARLYMSYNQITDISVMPNLVKVELLKLNHNPISDYTPLTSMESLRWLEAQKNGITDISFLSTMTRITHLKLEDNLIVDPSPLANLLFPNTGQIYLNRNCISDFSPISHVTVDGIYDQKEVCE